MDRLQNRKAVVIGGANGIGRAIAERFAAEGARVMVADRDAKAGQATVESIRGDGGDAVFQPVDVSVDADVEALMKAAVDQFGGIDILVNSAGIDIQGTVVATDPERWQRVLDVNLGSVWRACRFAFPHIIAAGGGAVVNISSVQGLFGYPHYAAYAASKAGMIGMSRQMVVDYADNGIRINVVSPAAIATDLVDNSKRLEPGLADDPGNEATKFVEPPEDADVPAIRAWGTPEDVAVAALFLASDEAKHVNGVNLVVDGGASTCII